MRKSLLTLAASFLCLAGARAQVNPKPFVVPELKSWQGAEGSVLPSGRIVVADAKLRTVAQALADDYQTLFGRTLTIAKGKSRAGDIVLTLKKDASLGEEGYVMRTDSRITLSAPTERGVFWATRTLLQVSEQDSLRALPKGTATDVPEYPLRGFMIDCGRKYIPMDYLRQLVKVLAYYKMNVLQVHLNDNGFRQFFGGDWTRTQAAFRLECETFPGLTAEDGSYTKREFVGFQKEAARSFVEVIPEIDVPAHSLAFTHYRPELASKDYGMDHLDLFNPAVYSFLDSLFLEYLGGEQPVFCGPRVHIGTDEYSNARQDVVEQFRAFTDHYIRYVEGFGKQAVVWGALTHAQGQTPVKAQGVLMNCWYNGFADPQEMKRQGYSLVSIPDGLVYIVPGAGYYHDYLDCRYLYDHWTPAVIGSTVFPENDPALQGGMFALWNDHVGNGITVQDIHHRVFPALQTLAVKCWTGQHTRLPYDDFDRRRRLLSEAPGVNALARLGKPGQKGQTVLAISEVTPGDTLPADEIGYDYSVSFTLHGQPEEKGAVLFRSPHAVLYLADPGQGRLAFEREGYLDTFNYSVEPGKTVRLTIEGTSRHTRLLVDGEERDLLGVRRLVALREQDKVSTLTEAASKFRPVVYDPKEQIHYHRTLFFPLLHAGNFKSRVTELSVVQK